MIWNWFGICFLLSFSFFPLIIISSYKKSHHDINIFYRKVHDLELARTINLVFISPYDDIMVSYYNHNIIMISSYYHHDIIILSPYYHKLIIILWSPNLWQVVSEQRMQMAEHERWFFIFNIIFHFHLFWVKLSFDNNYGWEWEVIFYIWYNFLFSFILI